MDIHRCRFVPYPTSPINALAFSCETSPADSAPKTLRLALGRANGDIELWDPKNGVWVQELVLKGGKDRSIEGLAWTHDLEDEGPNGEIFAGRLRLFSIGYSNAVTEWDIGKGMPLRNSSGNHGEVWCIAAQPRWNEKSDKKGTRANQVLAVGCSDGSIVLHSTGDGDLSFLRTLRRPSNLKARILSLTFKNRDTLIAGCSDSTIWIYDIRGAGRVKHTMSLGAGPKGGSNNILVWAVKSIGRDTLASGDSSGELRVWDLNTATQMQRVKCHDTDIHDIAANSDGTALLTAGSDRKMCRLQYNKESRRWQKISHQRVHRSEVKVMAVLNTRNLSVVVSGGNDSVPTLTPLRGFGNEFHRSLSNLPIISPVASDPSSRMLVSWWDREINVCRVTTNLLKHANLMDPHSELEAGSVMDKILIQGEEAITSVSIGPGEAQVLVVGTVTGCKVFRLHQHGEQNPISSSSPARRVKIRKLDVTRSLSCCAARHLQFSPDGRWLLTVQPDSRLLLHRFIGNHHSKRQIETLDSPVELYRRKRPFTATSQPKEGSLGEYRNTVCRVAWSSDSRIIVCSDFTGHLDAWVLTGQPALGGEAARASANGVTNGHAESSEEASESSDEGDSNAEESSTILGQSWSRIESRLPRLSTFPLVLSFRPTTLAQQVDKLVAITSLHEIYEYEVLNSRLSAWSRRNPPSHLPTDFLEAKERAMGCVWDLQNQKQRLWAYSSTALWMFDLAQDFPPPKSSSHSDTQALATTLQSSASTTSNKRKRKLDDDESSRQAPNNKQNLEGQARPGRSHGAGDNIPLPKARHHLGNDVRTTSTDSLQEGEETPRVSLDEGGSFRGSSDEEDESTGFGTNKDQDTSLALAQYRRNFGTSDETKGLPTTNGGLIEGFEPDGSWVNSVTDRPTESALEEGESGLDEGEEVARQDENAKKALLRGSRQRPYFWRTYKYRPILGIVPLARSEQEAVVGNEDDEDVPDLEVALVERPLWETDLDLPWES